MILAYWSDWGAGERVWAVVMYLACLFPLIMWWVFIPDEWRKGNRLVPVVGTIAAVMIMAMLVHIPFRMEQTRRDTLAVRRELAKLDGGEITYMNVTNKDSRIQLDFGDCEVELRRRHLDEGPWVFALFTGNNYVRAGPELQNQVDSYCQLIAD